MILRPFYKSEISAVLSSRLEKFTTFLLTNCPLRRLEPALSNIIGLIMSFIILFIFFSQILKICPRDLQSDLCLHIHSRIFESNKGFKKLSKTSLRAISRYLCTIRTATGDKVVCFGEYVDTIYFVATGALEVKSGANIMGLIGRYQSYRSD